MLNLRSKGETLTVTAPGAVTSGSMVKVGQLHGVACEAAASGADCEILMEGVFILPKKNPEILAQGDLLYWDDTNKVLTKTSAAGLTIVGAAHLAAANTDTTVEAYLDGVIRASV